MVDSFDDKNLAQWQAQRRIAINRFKVSHALWTTTVIDQFTLIF